MAGRAEHVAGDQRHVEGLVEPLQGLELVGPLRARDQDELEACGQLIDVEFVLRGRIVAEALQWLGRQLCKSHLINSQLTICEKDLRDQIRPKRSFCLW